MATFLLFAVAIAPTVCGQELVDFNRDVRPILSENCFFCHGQDENKREADLRLDLEKHVHESDVIVPGDPDNSLLIERIMSDDPDEVMPPPSSNRQLTDYQQKTLRQWIKQGGKYQTHWAFVTPSRPVLPTVRSSDWVRNPIDRFVLAKLENEDLSPSPEAARSTLIKRLSIDLTGLPPSPAQVDAFVADQDPQAYENLVDRLLESKHYGERLALPWLDAARYSDSNGFQQDGDTWQWIWRDWLVRALNEDLPFDQLTIWMLAGDLLPDASLDQKIASGFNRNHMLNGEGGAIAEEQRFVVLFDRMDTTATTWLGMTMACAQCHDHKYDPITQKDYYSLLDAFNRVPETGTPQRQSSRIRVARPYIELLTEENKKRIAEYDKQISNIKTRVDSRIESGYVGWKQGVLADGNASDLKNISAEVAQILEIQIDQRNEEQKTALEKGLRNFFNKNVRSKIESLYPDVEELKNLRNQLANYRGDQIPRPMVMSDAKPRNTHVLDRGQYLSPLEQVKFATPAFLPALPNSAPHNRLGLAQWLVMSENPLTARVQVNRMWQYFFGTGIVKSTEDLGVQSEYPIHRELLDWLAVEFRENGWSMKKLHRLIVTSATYRQSSRLTAELHNHDPENRLYGRASRFRMPAMVLRDWALASSGLINTKMGGAPVYPYQPKNVWEPLAITKERDFTYPNSTGDSLYRRSLYSFWRRTVGPANMFDSSNRQSCRVSNSITSTPLHALTTLNDPTWVEAARVLAEKCMNRSSKVEEQVSDAFQRVMCRQPSSAESALLLTTFEKQLEFFTTGDSAKEFIQVGENPVDQRLNPPKLAAMAAVCLGILNLDEALTRE